MRQQPPCDHEWKVKRIEEKVKQGPDTVELQIIHTSWSGLPVMGDKMHPMVPATSNGVFCYVTSVTF